MAQKWRGTPNWGFGGGGGAGGAGVWGCGVGGCGVVGSGGVGWWGWGWAWALFTTKNGPTMARSGAKLVVHHQTVKPPTWSEKKGWFLLVTTKMV